MVHRGDFDFDDYAPRQRRGPSTSGLLVLVSSLALVVAGIAVWFTLSRNRGQDAGASNEPGRQREPLGNFSYVPPEGWTLRDWPGAKFKLAYGPNGGNINFVDEKYKGSVEDYTRGAMDTLTRVLKTVKVVSNRDFVTSAGLKGRRVLTTGGFSDSGTSLRQVFYTFKNGDTFIVATCTVDADRGDKLDATFDATMKTFRFE